MKHKIIHGDCLEKLKKMPDNKIDCLITDPPYGISFMSKDWDKAVPSVEIWKECLRVMKPGSMGFVMSLPRSDVQAEMVLKLKEAGFRVDFSPIYWTYASGFPKATNISKAIDKKLGSGSDIAKELDGSYAGFQPKPAVEVVLVVMKPIEENTYTEQAMKNGKGITWLDDCRIPYESEDDKNNLINKNESFKLTLDRMKNNFSNDNERNLKNCLLKNGLLSNNNNGRYPANLLVSDDVLNDGKITKSPKPGIVNRNSDSDCAKFYFIGLNRGNSKGSGFGDSGSYSRYFDLDKWYEKNISQLTQSEQDIKRNSKKPYVYKDKEYKVEGFIKNIKPQSPSNYADSGSYSRYFDLDKWYEKNISQLTQSEQDTYPFVITPKASKGEKNRGLDEFEDKTDRQKGYGIDRVCGKCGAKMLKPEDCSCEEPEWITPAKKNNHPTVKPIKLMSYLITLGSRPNDIILDPFMGSGSTGCAAALLDRNFIGMELDEDFYKIAEARIEYHKKEKQPPIV